MNGIVNEENVYDYNNDTILCIKKNLKKNMITLGSLKKGNKLWLENNLLTIDNSYFPRIVRKMYGQNRQHIILFIDNMSKCLCSNDRDYDLLLLEKAIVGIDSMKKTYPQYFDKLTLIIARIDMFIFNNKNELP